MEGNLGMDTCDQLFGSRLLFQPVGSVRLPLETKYPLSLSAKFLITLFESGQGCG